MPSDASGTSPQTIWLDAFYWYLHTIPNCLTRHFVISLQERGTCLARQVGISLHTIPRDKQ